jgi:hypothetical protein
MMSDDKDDWDTDGFGWLPIALLVVGFTMGWLGFVF